MKFDTVLGLDISQSIETEKVELPEEVSVLVEKRKQARNEKNWEESDKLRDEINKLGYLVKDTKDGVEVTKV